MNSIKEWLISIALRLSFLITTILLIVKCFINIHWGIIFFFSIPCLIALAILIWIVGMTMFNDE